MMVGLYLLSFLEIVFALGLRQCVYVLVVSVGMEHIHTSLSKLEIIFLDVFRKVLRDALVSPAPDG